MKILVIFTGGTIGSSARDGWISPDGQSKRELIGAYEASHACDDVRFVISEPYTILSENLTADNLNALTATVREAAKEDYDGIIITHGTDTLQYSAAALSLALEAPQIPILLVSSNYPLDDERANGHANFAAAIEFIRAQAGLGVFVSYRNENRPVRFHRGSALLAHREADDSLCSLGGKYYAEMPDGEIVIKEKEAPSDISVGEFKLNEFSELLVVDICPGERYKYDLRNYKAVILRPYHSGTLNTSSSAFEAFCFDTAEKGVPIFVVNVNKGDAYASSKEFERLGIKAIYDSAFAATYIRLWIAVSRGEDLKNLF